jgi:predicted nuclease of predicted toxin-antitoxin system
MEGRGTRASPAVRLKILLDMNLSPDWVQVLVHAGHDAVHWADVGPANAPDTVIRA